MRQILIVLLLFPLFAHAQTKVTCVLKGEVKDRPQSSILYLACGEIDFRTENFIEIPIVNGKFEYTLHCDFEEVYVMAFEEEYKDGNMAVTPFMVENGKIDFVFYPRHSASKDKIKSSGQLGKLYQKYSSDCYKPLKALQAKRSTLPDGGISPGGQALLTEIEERRKAGEEISLGEEIKMVREFPNFTTKEDQILSKKIELERAIIRQSVFNFVLKDSSVVGLSLFEGLFRSYNYENLDNSILIDAFNQNYRTKFAEHPEGKKIASWIDSKIENQ